MTPQEHYDRAEKILAGSWSDHDIAVAQVHATLALAGFTKENQPRRLPPGFPG
jgi:exonuclease I